MASLGTLRAVIACVPRWAWIAQPLVADAMPRALRARTANVAPAPSVPWARATLRAGLEREHRRRRTELVDIVYGRATAHHERVYARHRQQAELATGLPRRLDPYLDPSLRSFVARIPSPWLLATNLRRGLFREAVRDLLPEALYRRLDKADFEPAMTRFVEALGGFARFRPLADVRMLASFDIIDPTSFKAEFERFAADPSDGTIWPRVWPFLITEAFAQAHFA